MSDHKNHGNHDDHQHHVTPMGLYVKIFLILIGFTVLTVVTSLFDFGIFNMVIAMAIACIKAGLVILFFMQLKYDDMINKVTFGASFAFLTIFILITGSDELFRNKPQPLKIEKKSEGGADTVALQNKLRIATPEQVGKGKELFAIQCATCHGPNGKGDGPAAAALNPKPRDFTSGYWRFGGAPTRVFNTVTKGSPGTGMASYAGLSVEDRYALVHYVRSLSPKAPADTPEDLKAAGLTGGAAAVAAKPQVEAPVDIVMANMEEPDQVVIPDTDMKNPSHPGAKIYRAQCMGCHGVNGVGNEVKPVGLNPRVTLITKSWVNTRAGWVNDRNAFVKIVSEGIPGLMPGTSTLTSQEWGDLIVYVKGLVH